jgi:hypothetical protein
VPILKNKQLIAEIVISKNKKEFIVIEASRFKPKLDKEDL